MRGLVRNHRAAQDLNDWTHVQLSSFGRSEKREAR